MIKGVMQMSGLFNEPRWSTVSIESLLPFCQERNVCGFPVGISIFLIMLDF